MQMFVVKSDYVNLTSFDVFKILRHRELVIAIAVMWLSKPSKRSTKNELRI